MVKKRTTMVTLMANHGDERSFGSSSSSKSAATQERMGNLLRNESYTTLSALEVHVYDLNVQHNPDWRLNHAYTDCLMWGGPRTDSRTVHEVRNYENEGSGNRMAPRRV